jgi:hypothetical protein
VGRELFEYGTWIVIARRVAPHIVRCRMVKIVFASAFFFLSACSAITFGPRVPQQANSSRFEPGSRTNSFDCNAGPGKYLELNAATSGMSFWVTGSMQVFNLRTASAWPPDAGVVFAGTSQWPRVGLETFVLADKPATLQVAVRGAGGGSDHKVFASVPISDSPIRFTLRLNGSGELSLSVGDAATSLSVGSIEITRMNLYCSSVQVHFSDVQMGSDN